MNYLDKAISFFWDDKKETDWSQTAKDSIKNVNPEANMSYYPIYTQYYDGEKDFGELGAPVNVVPDFEVLSIRSREQYLKNDIAKIIINAYVEWVIGAGLKIQVEPIVSEIEKEGLKFDREQFVKDAETRFRLYCKTTACDFAKNTNLIKIQRAAIKSAIIDGDVLVVLRTELDGPNIQLIESLHICTPLGGTHKNMKPGNSIKHGVEISPDGEHVAFYIAGSNLQFTRIAAKGEKTGKIQAFMIYGDEFRVDDVRGLPIYAANIEKMKKIDRYVEATVGSAEERAKIPFFIEHGVNSTNENPLINTLKMSVNVGEGNEIVNSYGTIEDTSKKVAQTTGKNVINLPNDSTLKSIESRNEIQFDGFVKPNFIFICASVGIPYEVALSKFENSFSASRMAAKQWEHILNVKRELFTDAFSKNFYNLFLELEILKGKINANGYFLALQKKDVILLEAYRNCRFIGAHVPHVDPLKEVNAEIAKIKNNLTTYEASTEALGSTDFESNMERLKKEKPMRAFGDEDTTKTKGA